MFKYNLLSYVWNIVPLDKGYFAYKVYNHAENLGTRFL